MLTWQTLALNWYVCKLVSRRQKQLKPVLSVQGNSLRPGWGGHTHTQNNKTLYSINLHDTLVVIVVVDAVTSLDANL